MNLFSLQKLFFRFDLVSFFVFIIKLFYGRTLKNGKNYIEIFICPIHLCNFCINVNNILSPSGENHLSPCTVEAFYHLLRGGIIKSIEGFFRSLQPFVTRAADFISVRIVFQRQLRDRIIHP